MSRTIPTLALWAAATLSGAAAPPRVLATIFPLYDWARAIAGPAAQVRQLLPPGAEVHSWAPTPSDVAALHSADLFLYADAQLEPWAERLLQSVGTTPAVFVASRHLPADIPPNADPHFWTDPLAVTSVVAALSEALVRLDPPRAEEYRARCRTYLEQVTGLDRDIRELVRRARRRTIIFAGHRAFDAFARRYGLTFLTPIEAFSPDAPPSPHAVAGLVRAVRDTHARVVYHEEILEPKIASVIAAESGAQLRRLHALHNRTPEEALRGETWLSLYRRNLEVLREGLDAP
ncbi:MAG: metal ABC transporter substrate-binding protein [Kiritimatiellae bacterium]|nr:metal ABC transporter substrate-binding protein [Kiritimatiellia bacterium]